MKSKVKNLRWSATVALVLVIWAPSPLVWSQMSQSAPTSIQELSQWPARERAQLQQKQTRFEQLGENEKQHLRQFHQTLQKDPARDQLTRIMHSYTQWLLALPSVERRRILSLPLAERLGEVEKIVNEQKASRFKELCRAQRHAFTAFVVVRQQFHRTVAIYFSRYDLVITLKPAHPYGNREAGMPCDQHSLKDLLQHHHP